MTTYLYLHPEIEQKALDEAVEVYRLWRQIVREKNERYTRERDKAERAIYSRLLTFPAAVTNEAIRFVNRRAA